MCNLMLIWFEREWYFYFEIWFRFNLNAMTLRFIFPAQILFTWSMHHFPPVHISRLLRWHISIWLHLIWSWGACFDFIWCKCNHFPKPFFHFMALGTQTSFAANQSDVDATWILFKPRPGNEQSWIEWQRCAEALWLSSSSGLDVGVEHPLAGGPDCHLSPSSAQLSGGSLPWTNQNGPEEANGNLLANHGRGVAQSNSCAGKHFHHGIFLRALLESYRKSQIWDFERAWHFVAIT